MKGGPAELPVRRAAFASAAPACVWDVGADWNVRVTDANSRAMGSRSRPWLLGGAIAVLALLLITILLIAMAPVGWLKGRVEAQLADATGGAVRIGAVERREAFSFSPTISATDIRIAQPAWAGPGDLLRLQRASVRVPLWQVLTGRFAPDRIALTGLRAHLVRDAQGRESWRRQQKRGDGNGPGLADLIIRDAIIRYDDAKRDRRATLRVTIDDDGFRLAGPGVVRGAAVNISARGPRIRGHTGAWPFSARIEGARLAMRFDGTMPAPLDLKHMRGHVTARGASLRIVDGIVEAGLPPTQPVTFSADVRRDAPDWVVDRLVGTIGASRLRGKLTVEKRDSRTRLSGNIDLPRLDFSDLSDDAGQARGRAKAAREGPRVVPDTRIDITRMRDLDGALEVSVARLTGPSAGPFRSLRTRLTLDRGVLTAQPLVARLARGTVRGRAVVDVRDRAVPLLTLDFGIAGSNLATLAGDPDYSGSLRGRVRLTGPGRTVRAAVARSNGSVALVATDGQLPARIASFIGLDIGRGITADRQEQASLRCLVFRLDVARGRGRLAPLVVDTSRSQSHVNGTIDLASERIAWNLTGAPKRKSLLRLDRPLPIGGTMREPQAFPPKGTRSVGSVLGMLGKAIAGDQRPLATDANCGALAARALS